MDAETTILIDTERYCLGQSLFSTLPPCYTGEPPCSADNTVDVETVTRRLRLRRALTTERP